MHPFSCSYSKSIAKLFFEEKITVILSTYQAGKVVLFGAASPDKLYQLPRSFKKPMGIALSGNKIAIASLNRVNILVDTPSAAKKYPGKPDRYDALYMPRITYHTGPIDLHDIQWHNDKLIAVNTKFSCLSYLDDSFSFKAFWKPKFITKLLPVDKCHLNGLAFHQGKPKYVTAIGKSDSPDGWRKNKTSGGILIDVETNEIILENLPMPHSPRIYNNQLYVLLSGSGQLAKVNTKEKSYEIVADLGGFARGMKLYKDYLFIALSKIRQSSKDFKNLPIADKAKEAGFIILHLPSLKIIGRLTYLNDVDEIFDIQVVEKIRPNIQNDFNDMNNKIITTEQGSFIMEE